MSRISGKNDPEPGKHSRGINSDTRELLLRELDERHRYSRFIAQAYLAWYTFFVTLNLYIMGVSLNNGGKILEYQFPMTVSFLAFNIIGVLAIFVIFRGTGNQRSRIDEVIKILNEPPAQNSITKQNSGVKPPCQCYSCRICRASCRICEVIERLLQKREPQKKIKAISPYPHYLFKLLSIVFAVSHMVLICFWIAFLIYGFQM